MITPVISHVLTAKDASYIILKDGTGAYNGSTNLGGYGTPNADVPSRVGLTIRYWPDSERYANMVTSSGSIIAGLMGAGYAFSTLSLGLIDGLFPSGVHHIKYYPLETSDTIVSLTQGSKLITRTAGTQPSAWNSAYKAVVILDTGNNVVSKILLIDRTQTVGSTFYVDQEWDSADVTGYGIMLATEADLKILIQELAIGCVVSKIGQNTTKEACDKRDVDDQEQWIRWLMAAPIRMQCSDFNGAHNLVTAVDAQCRKCGPIKSPCACN